MKLLTRDRLDELLLLLREEGYRVLGPTVRDGAVVHREIAGSAELPAGWRDDQAPGRYRLHHDGGRELFGYVIAAQGWKAELFPPERTLFTAVHERGRLRFVPAPLDDDRRALLGVRPCELRAIEVQDAVLRDGPYPDEAYASRRGNLFTIVVNCTRAAGTCFCTSQRSGPRATGGFDLALTELVDDGPHRFAVEAGSPAGEAVLERLGLADATGADHRSVDDGCARAAAQIKRRLTSAGLPEALMANLEHPRWDEVAGRCLNCGNCTQVCPTCFCTAVEDRPDLSADRATRTRRWDSCFNPAHSYVAGGVIRNNTRSRYRQWLTHKLATWHDQFGHSGCVGCGRCITWCPVGIDITEEANAVRQGA
ncbi:MAG: 4Fe-4S dicluster domain-containing protein [Gammaproteobacteria bacterium]|nr:4Fe-4S dicluster domain-containing protein [Gammaproteobacteria bacterium]